MIAPLSRQVKDLRARGRWITAAIAVPVVVVATIPIVERISAIDRVLAAEGARAVRASAYELPTGRSLAVPIEPDTDVVRFVVSPYRSNAPLEPTPRHVKMELEGRGDRRRREIVELDLPGIRTHLSAEDSDLHVGDPLAFSFDVHDLGVGDATLTLREASGADGILVRAYRREHLGEADTAFRKQSLDLAEKDRLATWAWEPGWNELADVERDQVLSIRWRKIGATRVGAGQLRSRVVAFSPPPSKPPALRAGALLGTMSVRKEERVTVLASGGAIVRAEAAPGIHLRAVLRAIDGTERSFDGDGVLEVSAPAGAFVYAIEWWSDEEAIVGFRATEPGLIEWLGRTSAVRLRGSKAVEIISPDGARAIRVGVRRPLPRASSVAITAVTVRVDVDDAAGKRTSRVFRADVSKSRVDRYDGDDPPETPTDPATFYVRLPKGGRAIMASADGAPVDLTLFELDPELGPEPLETRAMSAELPSFRIAGTHTWDGWVPRQPSNVGVFTAEDRPLLRIGRTIVPRPSPPPSFGPLAPAIAHVKHNVTSLVEKDGKRFDAIDAPFEIDPDAPRPLFVPIVVHAEEAVHVDVDLVLDSKTSLRSGLSEYLTHGRSVDVLPGNTRTTFTIGDDVPTGHHRLRITSTSKKLSVLLPWASTRAFGPRWIGGGFEE